jgi:hypothetical protein
MATFWSVGGESLALTILLILALAASLFWYVVPGHAFIYGPHLFIFGLIAFVGDLIRLIRGRPK